MPSNLFNQLQSNILVLVAQFRSFSIDNVNSPESQIALRALHILVHAELETYFEQLGLTLINAYSNGLFDEAQKSKLSYALLCYASHLYPGDFKTIEERINSNLVQLKAVINDNHGIKQKNILKILLPLNFPISLLNQTFLNTIESFGTKRGDLAHNGLHKITHLIGYNHINVSVLNIILPEMAAIDDYYISNYVLI